jgi:hypothetical protein
MSNYNYTLDGAFKGLLHNCNISAKRRRERGRDEAGVVTITYDDVKSLWDLQEGECQHSGIPMNYDKNEWRVSIDRLDNSKGYTKENIVLCCIEFNSRKMWTQEKIDEMLSILDKDITENFVDFSEVAVVKKKYGKVIYDVINGIKHRLCTYCNDMKPDSEFGTQLNACRKCLIDIRSKTNPRNRLYKLLHSTKVATQLRENRANDKMDTTHDIDLDFLIQLYNDQKGLCAYSVLPLQLIRPKDGNWAASVERKDPLKGYTKDNVCLVCVEFNVCDNTAKQNTTDSGTSGWTPEKFQLFIGYVWLRKGIIASEEELQIFYDMQKETIAREYKHMMRTPDGIKKLRTISETLAAIKKKHGQILLLTSPSGKKYAYQTDIVNQSIHNVFSNMKRYGHTKMLQEIALYGEDKFVVEPILTCKREDLLSYHDAFIKEYNTIVPHGLNPGPKKLCTDDTKRKIANTLRKPTQGHDGRELPLYMKFVNWDDRRGYRIDGHPLKKVRYFVNTPKSKIQNTDEELYTECLKYLNQLNASLVD